MRDWVSVYTSADCPWCTKVKELLNVYGVDFYEKRIDEDSHYLAEFNERGFRTVPQVMINDKVVGGYEKTRDQLREDFFGDMPHKKKAQILSELEDLDAFISKFEEIMDIDDD